MWGAEKRSPGEEGCSDSVEGLGGVQEEVSAPGPCPETNVERETGGEELDRWRERGNVGEQGEVCADGSESGPKESGEGVAEYGRGDLRWRCFMGFSFYLY